MTPSEPTARERAERRAGQLCGGEYDAGCPDCNLAVREFFIVWNEAIEAAARVADEAEKAKWAMFLDAMNRPKQVQPKTAADIARAIRALGGSDEGEDNQGKGVRG
jgi:hypothetical protein